jgi:hypothetical protein
MRENFTATEAARELGMTRGAIMKLIAGGTLQGTKRAGIWFLTAASVERAKTDRPRVGHPVASGKYVGDWAKRKQRQLERLENKRWEKAAKARRDASDIIA